MESETPMTTTRSTTLPVLVVGATGSLGGKVVDELLKRGKNVRALVRPTTDASRLESRGVEIARGDMLDLDSLVAAMNGADAVITTAAGYTRGGKNEHDIDTVGNAAVDADVDDGERIDIGWDRPVSMREMADLMGNRAGKKLEVWAIPSAVTRAAGAVTGRFVPTVQDMAAMFGWFDSGRYVAAPVGRSSWSAPSPRPRTPSHGTPTSWARRSIGDGPYPRTASPLSPRHRDSVSARVAALYRKSRRFSADAGQPDDAGAADRCLGPIWSRNDVTGKG
jgi:hypothetical protein